MNTLVLILLGLVAVVAADKPTLSYSSPEGRFEADDEAEPPKYGYDWDVEDGDTGNDFAHQEARDNDNTQGSYSVQLPDGRLQKVTYYVDGESGYVADITYEGEARYPDSQEHAAPRDSYRAP